MKLKANAKQTTMLLVKASLAILFSLYLFNVADAKISSPATYAVAVYNDTGSANGDIITFANMQVKNGVCTVGEGPYNFCKGFTVSAGGMPTQYKGQFSITSPATSPLMGYRSDGSQFTIADINFAYPYNRPTVTNVATNYMVRVVISHSHHWLIQVY